MNVLEYEIDLDDIEEYIYGASDKDLKDIVELLRDKIPEDIINSINFPSLEAQMEYDAFMEQFNKKYRLV